MASLKTSGLQRLEEKILEKFIKKDDFPKNHASPNTTYGVGSSSNYGHVKLSDSTTSTSGVSGGVAATPAAVKSVKAIADDAKTAAAKAVIPQQAYGVLHFTSDGGYNVSGQSLMIEFVPSVIKIWYVGTSSSSGTNASLCTILKAPTVYNGTLYTQTTTTWSGGKVVNGSIAESSTGIYYWQPMGSIGYYVYEIIGYKNVT